MSNQFSGAGFARFWPALVGPGVGAGAKVRVALHGLHPALYAAVDSPEQVERLGAVTVRMKVVQKGAVEMVFTPFLCAGDGATLASADDTPTTPNPEPA